MLKNSDAFCKIATGTIEKQQVEETALMKAFNYKNIIDVYLVLFNFSEQNFAITAS